jgi:hypothetical protein
MHKHTFITLTTPGKPALETLMLAASIRRFAGNMADSLIWVFVPQPAGQLPPEEQEQFTNLKASIIPYDIEPEIFQFPFAAKVSAAAVAETMAQGQTELLTWLDRDTIVINEPTELILPPDKSFGYRPVHHRLIGPAWGEPLDSFWRLIYQHCGVPDGRTFPMTTHVGEKILPYFNAGSLVVRPERRLLVRWWEMFQSSYHLPEYAAFYERDCRYAIFMHQAILTGVILQALNPSEMQELSHKINYPLHLHGDIPANLRPAAINELVTARYESIFDDPEWQQNFSVAEPLSSWLEMQPRVQNRPQLE